MEGEVISVFLPQKLGKKLRKRAEEMGYLPDELAVELLRERLKITEALRIPMVGKERRNIYITITQTTPWAESARFASVRKGGV